MKSTLITILVAASLAWTVPGPARAIETDTVAGLVAGLLAVGLIGKSVDDRKDHERAAAGAIGSRNSNSFVPAQRGGPGRLESARTVPLPDACLARVGSQGRYGGLVYGSQCLRRNFAFANQLPKSCEQKVRTDRGLHKVYGARCLRREGYRVEAWRGY